jgi:hypothetical protein
VQQVDQRHHERDRQQPEDGSEERDAKPNTARELGSPRALTPDARGLGCVFRAVTVYGLDDVLHRHTRAWGRLHELECIRRCLAVSPAEAATGRGGSGHREELIAVAARDGHDRCLRVHSRSIR